MPHTCVRGCPATVPKSHTPVSGAVLLLSPNPTHLCQELSCYCPQIPHTCVRGCPATVPKSHTPVSGAVLLLSTNPTHLCQGLSCYCPQIPHTCVGFGDSSRTAPDTGVW